MVEAAQSSCSSQDLLSLKGIRVGYGSLSVIDDLSLSVRRGEIFALMGKNGMGKTTLLKTILGFIPLRRGDVLLNSVSISGISPAKLVALGVSYAPQQQPLFQDLSIRDNLRLAVPTDREFNRISDNALACFPFLKDRLSQKAGTLSGGEQKMLILARALMLKPRLVLIDEISEGLQPSVVDKIAAALKNERDANGMTVLLVEQNLDFALKTADRWAVLKLGAIDDQGDIGPDTRSRILDHLRI
jgi:branched-chain amino acid transport system ATP-binding protein